MTTTDTLTEREKELLDVRMGGLAIYALLAVLLAWHWSVVGTGPLIDRPAEVWPFETLVFVAALVIVHVAATYTFSPEVVIDD